MPDPTLRPLPHARPRPARRAPRPRPPAGRADAGRRVLLPRSPAVERGARLRCSTAGRVDAGGPTRSPVLDRLDAARAAWSPATRDRAARRRPVAVLGAGPRRADPVELARSRAGGLRRRRWADPGRRRARALRRRARPGPARPAGPRAAPATSSYAWSTGVRVLGPVRRCPGVTACLRCVDAHRAVADPDHVAGDRPATSGPRAGPPDGVPDLADPALAALATAWAVRDVAAHLDGREPSTWSRTWRWAPDPADRSSSAGSRHPGCGCCWAADARAVGHDGGMTRRTDGVAA